MDPKPLHPLRLLPALLATPDHGRGHFESQIRQWLASQESETEGSAPTAPTAAREVNANPGHAALQAPQATASIPPMGGTIPEVGQ